MSSHGCAYSLVFYDSQNDQPTVTELKIQLEKGTDESKIETMKRILMMMLNGISMPELFMHIIRFVMPSKSKPLKKLLYIYYEACPKLDISGKLRQEWILVCNGIRFDLQHANEYIRGNTLRFLCKLREAELIEPLLQPTRQCLTHRHAYVRKYAVFAIASIYQHLPKLIPDAPELIVSFIEKESDNICRRNAFIALMNISPDNARQYLSDTFDTIVNADESLQLAELEFIRQDAATLDVNNSSAMQSNITKAKYLRLIFDLLEAKASTVVYEAAVTLVALTSNPVAIRAAADKFIDIAIRGSDNNVKLIVLKKVDALRRRNEGVLDDNMVMEILRVLSSSDIDVRKQALDIVLSMITGRNVEGVVMLLKKELAKVSDEQQHHQYMQLQARPGSPVSGVSKTSGKGNLNQENREKEYRALLIHAIHQCAIRFSQVTANVVDALMDSVTDPSNTSASDVISFVKEVVEKFPDLRSKIICRLISSLDEIRDGQVLRGALWVIGEYSLEREDIDSAWEKIKISLGEIPILQAEQRLLDEANRNTSDGIDDELDKKGDESGVGLDTPGKTSTGGESGKRNGAMNNNTRPSRVLEDGTYATENAFTSQAFETANLEAIKAASKPPLRQLIMDGDFYLATVLASALTKMVMRYGESVRRAEEEYDEQDITGIRRANYLRAEAMLIMVSIIRVGQSQFVRHKIDEDSQERIMVCLNVLIDYHFDENSFEGDEERKKRVETFREVFLTDTRKAFSDLVRQDDEKRGIREAQMKGQEMDSIDRRIEWRQLATCRDGELDDKEIDLAKSETTEYLGSKLKRVVQLTGHSDPVYVEAYVDVQQFDIILDVLVVNQTQETMRNMRVDFATLGDLRVIERATPVGDIGKFQVGNSLQCNVGAYDFLNLRAVVRVASTDTGVIFGNVVYEGASSTNTEVIILNDVHIDLRDYLRAAEINVDEFRKMWTEFEWENKINVNYFGDNKSSPGESPSLKEFLDRLMRITNMRCIWGGGSGVTLGCEVSNGVDAEPDEKPQEITNSTEEPFTSQFLSANLYARSIFGEDALANVSIEKSGPNDPITGFIRIRSRSQGLALSLGALRGLSEFV